MNAARRGGLRIAGVLLLLAGYAGLCHFCNWNAEAHHWGAAVALAPEIAIGFVLLWQWTSPPRALAVLLATTLLLVRFWSFFDRHAAVVFLIQDLSLYSALAWAFGRTLQPGRMALCTQFADRVHGPLSSAEAAYSRRVTYAWTLAFLALLVISVTLFITAPLRTWSFFANVCALPLMGCLFVIEYLVRLRVLPQVERPGLLASVRVYLASDR